MIDFQKTNESLSAADSFDIFLECVQTNSVEKVRNMIRWNKEFLTMKNSSGVSGLTHACEFNSLVIVRMFLDEFGLDIRETGRYGRNCFLTGAKSGKVETLKSVLAR